MAEQQKMDEPKGKGSRDYRILVLDAGSEDDLTLWIDYGFYAGANREAAIKKARAAKPELKSALADGRPVLAIGSGDFDPLVVKIETIERETFGKATGI